MQITRLTNYDRYHALVRRTPLWTDGDLTRHALDYKDKLFSVLKAAEDRFEGVLGTVCDIIT